MAKVKATVNPAYGSTLVVVDGHPVTGGTQVKIDSKRLDETTTVAGATFPKFLPVTDDDQEGADDATDT